MTTLLSFHAPYRCRDAGVCCSSGWPIPIDPPERRAAERALAERRAIPVRPVSEPFVEHDATTAVLAVVEGACVFYRRNGERRCELQRAAGPAAQPLACRQFPRVSVHDPRGTSVTLSHYCPTSAALLASRGAIAIVSDPPGFPADGEYVGLDARQSFPPSLRPDLLMDWESWWEWERLSVQAIADAPTTGHALSRLRAAVEAARVWRPADSALVDAVRRAFEAKPASPFVARHAAVVRRDVIDALPAGVPVPSDAETAAAPGEATMRRFLAAHAFANWTAHLGRGLRTWLRSIEAAYVLASNGSGVRGADLWIRHLADPQALADTWSAAEDVSP